MADEEFAGFAPPPFKPDEALLQLRRNLHDLRLAERGNGFELRGRRVVELTADDATIAVRLARRLQITPQWDSLTLRSTTDQRKLLDEVKKRLARWEQEE